MSYISYYKRYQIFKGEPMENNKAMTDNNITFNTTPQAIKELDRLLKEEDQKYFVRIGVQPGGCSGMSYTLAFETDKLQDDQLFEYDTVEFLINNEALPYLNGATLDFKDSLMGGGFYFSNPNASRSCGCGSSFSC